MTIPSRNSRLSRATARPMWLAAGLALAVSALTVNAASPTKVKAEPKVVERVVAFDSGQIEGVYMKVGDRVVAEQVLVQLDEESQVYAFEVAKLKAKDETNLRKAQAKVVQQCARLEDMRDRRRRRQVTDYTVAQAESDVDMAQAEMQRAEFSQKLAKMELDRAEKALEKRKMRAPISGVVLEVSKTRGDMIGKGTVVARIGDPSEITLSVQLPQKILAAVREAGTVPLRLASGEVVQASVQSVGGKVKDHPELREVVLASADHDPDQLSLTDPFEVEIPDDPGELPPPPAAIPDPIIPPSMVK